MIFKGVRQASAFKSKPQAKTAPPPEAHTDEETATAPQKHRPPFPLDSLPDHQAYMPFIVFLPPPMRGENGNKAESVRRRFLQESLYIADRWHERIEQIHLDGKIDQQKRDDFHEHIANVLDDLRNNADAEFWLSVEDKPANKFTHELIRDYLAENTNNRPRERRKPGSSPRVDATADFFIPADDFLSRGCTTEPGLITYHSVLKDDCIIFGPYRPYPVGLYEAKFDLSFAAKVAAPGLKLIVDVFQGEKILASAIRESLTMAYSGGAYSLQFTNSDPGTNLEFRVHVSGVLEGSKISFRGVSLFKA